MTAWDMRFDEMECEELLLRRQRLPSCAVIPAEDSRESDQETATGESNGPISSSASNEGSGHP